ncbi:MAG: HAD family hydrolase [Blastocatellia bacterium]
MHTELVVFDLAGTTVRDHDDVNRCFREALATAGLRISAARVNAVMGLAKPEAIRRLALETGGRDYMIDTTAIHADFVARMTRHYREDASVREITGVSEMFRQLRGMGIMAAVNTGFSREITDTILARMGWLDDELIAASISSDETPRGRPWPDMIQALMRRLNIHDSQRVAKIGDTPADLFEGQNAGCGLIIGVTSGASSREQLQAAPHTHLLEIVAELPALLSAPH